MIFSQLKRNWGNIARTGSPGDSYLLVILCGNKIEVFETDCGPVGVLICYDVEFPELARLAALQGAQIILVPFWTDTKNAYQRVRYCSQARAI